MAKRARKEKGSDGENGEGGRVAFPFVSYSAVTANRSRSLHIGATWPASVPTRGDVGSEPSPLHYSARAKIEEGIVVPRFLRVVRSNPTEESRTGPP